MTADISTVLKMLVAYRKQLTAKSCLMDFVKDTNIKTDVDRATGEAESRISSPVSAS